LKVRETNLVTKYKHVHVWKSSQGALSQKILDEISMMKMVKLGIGN